MKGLPDSMRTLIAEFSKMPGIGPKSAQRLAFFILTRPAEEAKKLSEAIMRIKDTVKFCRICNNLSDRELCDICSNENRDKGLLCVVERPSDVISIEKMGYFTGVYHVLLGALSPLDGVGPKDLKIDELIKKIKRGGVKEVIIATDSDTEGETTALYLIKVLKPLGIRLYRIASGMPAGTNLEYADQATLYKAFEGKKEV
ncbi:MAG: recombination protein RecR [Omnitrophica bacterium RBG_13_46_9]|nr:MAG: recombination protein RecR [Omnitrophica bacterium RBG_13_46_9]